MKFTEYKGLDLVATGNEVLDRWRKNHAFEKSLELREGAPEFIFFEGPPSANGMYIYSKSSAFSISHA